jgi:hypothetical protein
MCTFPNVATMGFIWNLQTSSVSTMTKLVQGRNIGSG